MWANCLAALEAFLFLLFALTATALPCGVLITAKRVASLLIPHLAAKAEVLRGWFAWFLLLVTATFTVYRWAKWIKAAGIVWLLRLRSIFLDCIIEPWIGAILDQLIDHTLT